MDYVVESFDIVHRTLCIHAGTPATVGIQRNFQEVLVVKDMEGEVIITEEVFGCLENGDVLVCVDMNAGQMPLSSPFRVEYDPDLLTFPVRITAVDYETGMITYSAREACKFWIRRNGGIFDTVVFGEEGKGREVYRPVFRAEEHGGTVRTEDVLDCLSVDGITVLSEEFVAEVPRTKALLVGKPETVRFLRFQGLNKAMTIRLVNPEGSITLEEEALTRSDVDILYEDGRLTVHYTGV
jgi:hypothetical protein